MAAHLCPLALMGVISCEVNRLINQDWTVEVRLFTHRPLGSVTKSPGRSSAPVIRGIPNNTGLMNWSKKLKTRVNLMVLVGVDSSNGDWVR